jgi:hypothetical protein
VDEAGEDQYVWLWRLLHKGKDEAQDGASIRRMAERPIHCSHRVASLTGEDLIRKCRRERRKLMLKWRSRIKELRKNASAVRLAIACIIVREYSPEACETNDGRPILDLSQADDIPK